METHFHKNLHMKVHSSCICSSPQTGHNQDAYPQVNDSTVVHPYQGTLLSDKKEHTGRGAQKGAGSQLGLRISDMQEPPFRTPVGKVVWETEARVVSGGGPDSQSGPLNQQRKHRSLQVASDVLQMSWKQSRHLGHENNSREEK